MTQEHYEARKASAGIATVPEEPSRPISGPVSVIERGQAVVTDSFGARRRGAYTLLQWIYVIFGLIEGLIGIRFVLKLLGANPTAPFTSLIYTITAPLVAPFDGIFATTQRDGYVLEPHSIGAVIVYALLSWVIARVMWLLFTEA